MGAQKITTAGFLSEFLARHKKMFDRPFCWVLGSGASYPALKFRLMISLRINCPKLWGL
jgi:hypothetical protein